MVAVPLLTHGMVVALILFGVVVTHALAFAAGVWWYVRRNHQAGAPVRSTPGRGRGIEQ